MLSAFMSRGFRRQFGRDKGHGNPMDLLVSMKGEAAHRAPWRRWSNMMATAACAFDARPFVAQSQRDVVSLGEVKL